MTLQCAAGQTPLERRWAGGEYRLSWALLERKVDVSASPSVIPTAL
jgi:hypothetical protein